MNSSMLIQLYIVHFLFDFVFQKDSWIHDKREKKWKSKYYYAHIVLHTFFSYVVMIPYTYNPLPAIVIGLSHAIIDYWKMQKPAKFFYFFADQILHLLVIGFIWVVSFLPFSFNYIQQAIYNCFQDINYWIIILAYIVITNPTSILIQQATHTWREKVALFYSDDESLKSAGKWIGILERIIILSLVLVNQYSAIGFLVAAKSILRFKEINDNTENKNLVEYYLIGTLLSISITLLVGIFVVYIIK